MNCGFFSLTRFSLLLIKGKDAETSGSPGGWEAD